MRLLADKGQRWLRRDHSLRNWYSGIWFAVSLYVLVLPTPVRGQEAPQVPADVPDRAWAVVGSDIFEANCQPCHGPEGRGDGPVMAEQDHAMIDFTEPAQLAEHSPAEWVEVTRTGRIEALMPPWENQLTAEEIWDVVAFLWQLALTEEELAQGADLWQSLREAMPLDGGPRPSVTAWTAKALALTPEEWRTVFPRDFRLPPDRVLTLSELDLLHRFLQSQILTPAWFPPLRQGTGDLSGSIIPRSPDQILPSDLPVTLTASTGTTVLQELQTTLDQQNRFVFQHLDPVSRLDYQVHVQLDNLTFASAAVTLSPEEETKEIQLPVYSPTTSADGLEVRRMHVILSVGAERILVGQTAWLVNGTPYVFTGNTDSVATHPVTVQIPLAPGAAELTIAEDQANRFTLAEDVLLDSQPVYPAPTGNWVTVGYSLPLSPALAEWSQAWVYPLQNVTVRISDLPGLTVRLPGFELAGQEALDDQSFTVWQADSLPDGHLAVYFDALPADPTLTYQMPPWMPWAVTFFLLIVIATTMFWPRRSSPLNPG